MSYLAQYCAVPETDPAQRVQLVTGWIRSTPRAFFAELRQQQPVFQTPGFTLVTRYRDVVDVLRRTTQFSVRIYGQRMDSAVGCYMLGRDNSLQNYRDRSLMQLMLPWSDVPQVRDIVRQSMSDLLPTAEAEVDVIKLLSRVVPIRVCGEYFGFSGPDVQTLLRWAKATQTDFFKNIAGDEAIHQAAIRAGKEMKVYLAALVQERTAAIRTQRNASQDTVLDRLICLSLDGHLPLDPQELLVNIAGLLIGSIETTSQATAQALEQILLRPEIRQLAIQAADANDVLLLTQFARESLRFRPINPLLFRFTESEACLAEGTDYAQRVSRGAIVFACTASAMWDDRVLEHADEFRIDRPSHHYLHYGHGSHQCLGEWIGEAMQVEMLSGMLKRAATRIPGPRGEIDFAGGPFPESYVIKLAAAQR